MDGRLIGDASIVKRKGKWRGERMKGRRGDSKKKEKELEGERIGKVVSHG